MLVADRGHAQRADDAWRPVVDVANSGRASDARPRKASKTAARPKAAATSNGHSSASHAIAHGALLPAAATSRQPSNIGLETGSVDSVKAVPSIALPSTTPSIASPFDASSTAGRFCISIKPQVEEMRIAFQKKTLAEVEAELDKRMKLLEAKITEYKQWLERRQEFSSKAQDALVKIYTKMRPDAAAQQLASADIETAAAVVLKLDPRAASAILNDMDPKLAATLASVIAGAARTNDEATKPAVAAP